MKAALVHDWLTGMRGGERVLERLCAMFPDATIHTLLWNRGSVSPSIESHPIEVSFIQRMPRASRSYRWYLPLFPRAIERMHLDEADTVISTSHCAAKAVRTQPGTFHLSYVFTPMRYIWELESQYFPPGRFRWPASWYVQRACARLRVWDAATASRPDTMIAISQHVAARIARHYAREVEVIYPPVELDRFEVGCGDREGYLLAGAFAPYKRGDLAIEACGDLGRPLRVVGSGQDEQTLKRRAGSSVEFLGWVDDKDMPRLYREARALIFPGEEDFGIVPVEAMASGCPVIAFGRGGALETIGRGASAAALARVEAGGIAAVPGGVLFGTQTAGALAAAIRLFESSTFDPHALRAAAQPFASQRFDREFRAAFERHRRAWAKQRVAPVPAGTSA